MKVKKAFMTLAGCGLLLAPLAALAQEGGAQQERQPAGIRIQADERAAAREGVEAEVKTRMRSNELIGLEVRNKDGKDLGDVEDLLVDLKTGKVKHVVLSFGGFLGVGSRLFAIPWDKAEYRHGEDDKFFVYNVTEQQLENAPSFERDMWPNVNDPEWNKSLDRHYGSTSRNQPTAQERPSRQDTVQPEQQPRAADQARPDVDTQQQGQVSYDTVYRASTIKDLEVQNQAGEELGSMDDLIIDVAKGSVEYATLTHGATLGVGGKAVAVPFDRFKIRHTEEDRHLVLNATPEQLRSAKEFNRDTLKDRNWAADVDRHFGAARTAEQPGETRRE